MFRCVNSEILVTCGVWFCKRSVRIYVLTAFPKLLTHTEGHLQPVRVRSANPLASSAVVTCCMVASDLGIVDSLCHYICWQQHHLLYATPIRVNGILKSIIKDTKTKKKKSMKTIKFLLVFGKLSKFEPVSFWKVAKLVYVPYFLKFLTCYKTFWGQMVSVSGSCSKCCFLQPDWTIVILTFCMQDFINLK